MDGLQVAGYSAAVTAAVHGLVWVAKKLTEVRVDEAAAEAAQDAWFRTQLEKAGVRESDCTQRVNTLTQKVADQDVKIGNLDNRLRSCHEGRATDMASFAREMRIVTSKYNEIREIVDVIRELPESRPPPPIAILQGDEP